MPLLIAHRGGALEAFENSFSAFEHALKVSADSIEADLRATKNGEIVIMHDASLRRTTGATGKIKDHTLKELRKIKLKNGEPIPTLEELLKLAEGKISLHLEIKEPGFEKALVRALIAHRMLNSVYVISFDPEILRHVHALNPKIKTGFIFAKPGGEKACPPFCKVILPREDLVTPKSVKRFSKMRKQIHTWVINDPARAKQLLALGLDGIATDRPGALQDS